MVGFVYILLNHELKQPKQNVHVTSTKSQQKSSFVLYLITVLLMRNNQDNKKISFVFIFPYGCVSSRDISLPSPPLSRRDFMVKGCPGFSFI